jgi:hypothetical protein
MAMKALFDQNPSEAPFGIGQQASDKTVGIEFGDLPYIEGNGEFFDWNGYLEIRLGL